MMQTRITVISIILIVSLFTSILAKNNNQKKGRYTFIMIHFEAGYKTCKKNNLPPGLKIPMDNLTKPFTWQKYFWPTVIDLVQKADKYDIKLTLAFNPQWAEYILKNRVKVELVKQWIKKGHEISFHHHGINHVDWNGYSNRPQANKDSLYLGKVNDGYKFVEQLASPYHASSGTLGDLPIDLPSQMDKPGNDLIFAEGNALSSYPQLGHVKSLKPHRDPKPNGGFRVHFTIREYSTVMPIPLHEAIQILKEQYKNMNDDDVFGIVWHEFDYYRLKDKYIEWFKFIQEQGDKVSTVKEINTLYFK